jgi:putative heme-binding domain-containing protein
MRYRSDALGKEYQGNLFTAQFNRHRIQRHILERHGAGFKCKTEDFLTSDDKNFHPTDVFEDADGSLIVIDTGGWFRIGCPTSQTAKPEFKGAIYRIRKTDMKPMNDDRVNELRALSFSWTKRATPDVAKRLLYLGPAARDRAIQELADRGNASLPVLEQIVKLNPDSTQFRRDALWAATRIESAEARRFVRSLVPNQDLGVKLVAIHAIGLHRDAKALPELLKIVAKDHPAAQRNAATALGRIKHPDAIAPIMEAMRTSNGDRFLEHALIYALIQIDQRDKTAPYLKDADPYVRRAALIALDQMENGKLTREELADQLTSDNKALIKTALDIVASRPSWAGEIVGLLRDWLITQNSKAIPPDNLRGVLLALSKEPAIQKLIIEALEHPDTIRSDKLMLIETIGQAPVAKLPPAWLEALGKSLDHTDDRYVKQGIAAIRARSLTQFDGKLEKIVQKPKLAIETRVQAFAAVAPRVKVDEQSFAFMLDQLKPDGPPLLRLAAARGFSEAKLDEAQYIRLAKQAATAGPLELPVLVASFEKSASPAAAQALLAALEKSPSLTSLTAPALSKALQRVPDDARYRVQDLSKRLNLDAAKQKDRLDDLMPLATGGSIEQGRDIYFGNKASCSACHAINNKGGGVGPDLGKIGAIRSGRDLLESIVFPSASFARGFEPYVVETKAGKTHNGILARESTDAVYLLTTERVEIRIGREEIESFVPGRVSIMPQGLDTTLSRRELQDLLAYLQSLR